MLDAQLSERLQGAIVFDDGSGTSGKSSAAAQS